MTEVLHWWDEKHAGNSTRYLTGSTGKVVWDFLKIEKLLIPNAHVLEIGVGLGFCTRDVVARGVRLSVLDISEVALARVRDFTYAQYQTPDNLPSGGFDLVFSHLVVQHMSDEDLLQQMKEVLRALRPKGIFAFQFADCGQRSQTTESQRIGGCCRSVVDIEKIVQEAVGEIVDMSEARWFSGLKRLPAPCWFAAHIRK